MTHFNSASDAFQLHPDECQPDKNELGGMVVNFREKALRRVHTYTGPGALSVALVQ